MSTKKQVLYLKEKKWQLISVKLKSCKASKRVSKILFIVLYRGYRIEDIPQDEFEEFSRVTGNVFNEFIDDIKPIPKTKPDGLKVRYCTSHLFDRSNEKWSPVNRLAH